MDALQSISYSLVGDNQPDESYIIILTACQIFN